MGRQENRRIRVLMAKVGLDSHWTGALLICRALQDAGMEVIFTGLYQSPEKIVNTALEEDVDIIGLSMLGGYPKGTCSDVVRMLKEKGASNVPVVAGGLIPEEDIPDLENMGVTGNFGAGTPLQAIVDHIRERVLQRRRVVDQKEGTRIPFA